jgi:hypothetical protein
MERTKKVRCVHGKRNERARVRDIHILYQSFQEIGIQSHGLGIMLHKTANQTKRRVIDYGCNSWSSSPF